LRNAVLFAAFLAFTAPAFGQAAGYRSVVQNAQGHAVAGATITVCAYSSANYNSTGAYTGPLPCTSLVTVYADPELANAITPPLLSDGRGNYAFFVSPGTYTLTITDSGRLNPIGYAIIIGMAGNTVQTRDTGDTRNKTNLGGPGVSHLNENKCFQGARPWIDVTCYGAKGNGSNDDTAAVIAAINAACAQSYRPTVVFPPGNYAIDQTQGASNTTPDLPSCSFLRLLGLGNGTLIQFGQPTQAYISVTAGANPSPAPIFSLLNEPGITIENLGLNGYNQAIWANNTVGFWLINTCLRAQTTGQTDNTPLKLTDMFDFWAKGGCWESLNGSVTNGALPVSIWDGETNPGATPTVYLMHVEDTVMAGGPIHYSQRVNTANCPTVWTFRNILREATSSDFIYITNDTGNLANIAFGGCGFGPIDIQHFTDADNTASAQQAVINFNPSGSYLTGITISHAQTIGQFWEGAAVRLTGTPGTASIYGLSVTGCKVFCDTGVFDANGNPTGPASMQNRNSGWDFTVNTSDPQRLSTYLNDGQYGNGPALRLTPIGQSFSMFGLDPAMGAMFADGASYGYTAQVTQSTKETLDIGFSSTLPPTGVTATAASGGTLANGTYYYFVVPVLSGHAGSCAQAGVGAPSLVSSGATTTTGKNTVNIAWTDPVALYPGTIVGYCVVRNTTPTIYGANTSRYVSGAGATSAKDTGSSFTVAGYSGVGINLMQPQHRFTPTSLGVNTTNPQYNLDVNGSARASSYNTWTNCSSSASPAVCGSASAGSVAIAASSSTVVVDTTAVTAQSQIVVTFDSSLGTKLGVTCNATPQQPYVSARTAGTSFTISVAGIFSTHPGCFSYLILN